MITLELDWNMGLLMLGAVLLLAMAVSVLVLGLWRETRRLQRSVRRVDSDMAVYAEASIAVARAVETGTLDAGHNASLSAPIDCQTAPSRTRDTLLDVARTRLLQGQPMAELSAELGLLDDEVRLLSLGSRRDLQHDSHQDPSAAPISQEQWGAFAEALASAGGNAQWHSKLEASYTPDARPLRAPLAVA